MNTLPKVSKDFGCGFEQVSDAVLSKYASLVYDRTGIRISPQKKSLLSNRLRRRLRETKIPTYEAYLKHLVGIDAKNPEWDAFLQEITTHETFLFRDEPHWDWFRNTYLPSLDRSTRPASAMRTLRVWSAACSTGDEPVTIACCLAEWLSARPTWKAQVVGTDIGIGAIEQARQAVFNERSMRLVPAAMRQKYFQQLDGNSLWQAKPVLTNLIQYKHHNLMNPLREPLFDVVFIKNVLIYFDPASKQKVLAHVRNVLRPGGLLVAGAAEGISDLVKDLKRQQAWLYCVPEDAKRQP